MRTTFLFCFAISLGLSSLRAQRLEPFGLEGKIVTSIATCCDSLYAGTVDEGVYVRSMAEPGSGWLYLGLSGVRIRAVYPFHLGSNSHSVMVGTEVNQSPDDTCLVYYSSGNQIWTPADGGLDPHYIFYILMFDGISRQPLDQEVFAGGFGGVYHYSMNTGRWENVLAMSFGATYTVRVDQQKRIVWAGGEPGCAFEPIVSKSLDYGETWLNYYPPFEGPSNACYSLAFHPLTSDTLYAGLNRVVMKSIDSGQNWRSTALKDVPVEFSGLAIDSGDPLHIWAGGMKNISDYALWESTDGGKNWNTVVLSGNSLTWNASRFIADPATSGVLYFTGLGSGVWRYENPTKPKNSFLPMQIGNRWTFSVAEPFSTAAPETVTETIVDTVHVGDSLFYRFDRFGEMTDPLMRMTADNKLLVMIDGTPQVRLDFAAAEGDTWRLPGPYEDLTWEVRLDSTSEKVVSPVGTFADCYRFQILGKSSNEYVIDYGWVEWYASGFGPVMKFYGGAIPQEYLLIEAWVNGVDYSTDVAQTSPVDLPQGFRLFVNYPNPFNATTTIRFELPLADIAKLEVYSLLGQRLRTLVSGRRSPGQHQVLWDGRDDAGNNLPSGVYLYRLSAGEFVATKRMVLLR